MVCPMCIAAGISQIALPAASVVGGALAAKFAVQQQCAQKKAKIHAPQQVKVRLPDQNLSLKQQSAQGKSWPFRGHLQH
jgi:hypothetical protein